MSVLSITIEIDGFKRQVRSEGFDPADLHPDRRAMVLALFDSLLRAAAQSLGVHDDFVETLRMQRDEMGAAAFEELMADMNPLLRPRLVAAGLLADV